MQALQLRDGCWRSHHISGAPPRRPAARSQQYTAAAAVCWTAAAAAAGATPATAAAAAAGSSAAPADEQQWHAAVQALADHADALGAAHMFSGATAAALQGVQLPFLPPLELQVQWDALPALQQRLLAQQQQQQQQQQQEEAAVAAVSSLQCRPGGRNSFSCRVHGVAAQVACSLNTVLQLSPQRVPVQQAGRQIWCQSLLAVRGDAAGASPPDEQLAAAVTATLQQLQAQLTAENGRVWSQSETSDAWQQKLGSPADAAAWILSDPLLRLGPALQQHLPRQLQGCRLINLMGSHGAKAVAAAALGARVTCVDISPTNAQYGRALAAAAGVHVRFVTADVLQLPEHERTGDYDVVLLELGVLHYFLDLQPLMQLATQLLAPGGRLCLREFHPVSTKLLASRSRKAKVAGNYFCQQLRPADVAYSKYANGGAAGGTVGGTAAKVAAGSSAPRKAAGSKAAGRQQQQQQQQQQVQVQQLQHQQVQLRQWGLGEVVTAVARAGLVLVCLEEEPGTKLADEGLPKLFTLVAERPR